MENTKLANGSRHESSIGGSRPQAGKDQTEVRPAGKRALRKEAAPIKVKTDRPRQKEMISKPNPDRLVCRYCGSDDLAPSFVKRRDRRCRECFKKRYGSAAKARKTKVKK
jgi:hypothetical protein